MARELVKEIKDSRKNYFINGDMAISQRGTSFAAAANQLYSVDRMQYIKSGTMVHTITQDTDVPTVAQSGRAFQNSLRLNLTTPDTSIAGGEYVGVGQILEGYNWVNLAKKSFTISFWVKATLPGTYCVALQNSGADRCYAAEYTINAVSTWEYKSVTIAASPADGTWNYTTGAGLKVFWTLAVGSTFHATPGTWATGTFLGSANQVNGVNTGATDFRLTGIMINEGEAAAPFKLFGEDIEAEYAACQRYAQSTFPAGVAWAQAAGVTGAEYTRFTGSSNQSMTVPMMVRMRAAASVTTYNPVAANGNARNTDSSVDIAFVDIAATSTRDLSFAFNSGAIAIYRWHWSATAELS